MTDAAEGVVFLEVDGGEAGFFRRKGEVMGCFTGRGLMIDRG